MMRGLYDEDGIDGPFDRAMREIPSREGEDSPCPDCGRPYGAGAECDHCGYVWPSDEADINTELARLKCPGRGRQHEPDVVNCTCGYERDALSCRVASDGSWIPDCDRCGNPIMWCSCHESEASNSGELDGQ